MSGHHAGGRCTYGSGSDHSAIVCAGVGVSLCGTGNADGLPVCHFLCLPDEPAGVEPGKTAAWACTRDCSNLPVAAEPGGAVLHFHGAADRPRRGTPGAVAAGSGEAKFGTDRGTIGRTAWLELPNDRPASRLHRRPQ